MPPPPTPCSIWETRRASSHKSPSMSRTTFAVFLYLYTPRRRIHMPIYCTFAKKYVTTIFILVFAKRTTDQTVAGSQAVCIAFLPSLEWAVKIVNIKGKEQRSVVTVHSRRGRYGKMSVFCSDASDSESRRCAPTVECLLSSSVLSQHVR